MYIIQPAQVQIKQGNVKHSLHALQPRGLKTLAVSPEKAQDSLTGLLSRHQKCRTHVSWLDEWGVGVRGEHRTM